MGLIDSIKRSVDECSDIELELVEVPEWNTEFYLKTMSLKERREFSEHYTALPEDQRTDNLQQLLIIASSVDEDGAPVFSYDDMEWLSNRSGKITSRLFEASNRLNKILDLDIEEEIKN